MSLRKTIVLVGLFWLTVLTIIFFFVLKKEDRVEEVLSPTATPSGFEFPFDGPFEFIEEEHHLYFPIIGNNMQNPCLSRDSEKAGLAWANRHLGFNHISVCFPDDYVWHNWNWKTPNDRKRSVLWGDVYLDQWKAGTPTTYSGLVLFANEADRPDQADMTPEEVAQLAIDALDHAPNICLVGPMYSAADNGVRSRQFFYEFIRLGGNPNKLCYGSVHIYPRPGGNSANDARERINEYYSNYLIPTGQGHKKVFVTEVGYRSDAPDWLISYRMKAWLCDLEQDTRVKEYYIFTSYYVGIFAAIFEVGTNDIEPLGEATRLVLGGRVCN